MLNKIIFFFPGGFAFVFVAQDNASGKEYALKVILRLSKSHSNIIL